MKELKEQFDQGKRRKKYPLYHRLTERIRLLRKTADAPPGERRKRHLNFRLSKRKYVEWIAYASNSQAATRLMANSGDSSIVGTLMTI